jgi:hypothetical protein
VLSTLEAQQTICPAAASYADKGCCSRVKSACQRVLETHRDNASEQLKQPGFGMNVSASDIKHIVDMANAAAEALQGKGFDAVRELVDGADLVVGVFLTVTLNTESVCSRN